jgi:hypothetical protein
MTPSHPDNDQPDEFGEVEERLRRAVPPATPAELDQIKLRAMSQAKAAGSGGRRRAPAFVSWFRVRWLSLGLATVILGGTAATGVASDGFQNWGGNAAQSQYQPHHCYGDHGSWAHSFGHDGSCRPDHHRWWWHNQWHSYPPPGTGTTTTGTDTDTTTTGTDTGTVTIDTGTTTGTETGTTVTETTTTGTGTGTTVTPPPVHHRHHKKPVHHRHHKKTVHHKHKKTKK